jgi:hypothetical protein
MVYAVGVSKPTEIGDVLLQAVLIAEVERSLKAARKIVCLPCVWNKCRPLKDRLRLLTLLVMWIKDCSVE